MDNAVADIFTATSPSGTLLRDDWTLDVPKFIIRWRTPIFPQYLPRLCSSHPPHGGSEQGFGKDDWWPAYYFSGLHGQPEGGWANPARVIHPCVRLLFQLLIGERVCALRNATFLVSPNVPPRLSLRNFNLVCLREGWASGMN